VWRLDICYFISLQSEVITQMSDRRHSDKCIIVLWPYIRQAKIHVGQTLQTCWTFLLLDLDIVHRIKTCFKIHIGMSVENLAKMSYCEMRKRKCDMLQESFNSSFTKMDSPLKAQLDRSVKHLFASFGLTPPMSICKRYFVCFTK